MDILGAYPHLFSDLLHIRFPTQGLIEILRDSHEPSEITGDMNGQSNNPRLIGNGPLD